MVHAESEICIGTWYYKYQLTLFKARILLNCPLLSLFFELHFKLKELKNSMKNTKSAVFFVMLRTLQGSVCIR